MADTSNTTGFQTGGFTDKKGTPHGEAARFNVMPPGESIENQPMLKVPSMPLKKLTPESYPGDGY